MSNYEEWVKTNPAIAALVLHELQQENAALRRWHEETVIEKDDAQRALTNAKAENAALLEDKARLDWLAISDAWFDTPADEAFTPRSFRDAIDAVRKNKAQP